MVALCQQYACLEGPGRGLRRDHYEGQQWMPVVSRCGAAGPPTNDALQRANHRLKFQSLHHPVCSLP